MNLWSKLPIGAIALIVSRQRPRERRIAADIRRDNWRQFRFTQEQTVKNGPSYCLWIRMFFTVFLRSKFFNNFLSLPFMWVTWYIGYLNMVWKSSNKTIHFYSGVNTYTNTYTNCEIAQCHQQVWPHFARTITKENRTSNYTKERKF